MGCLGFHVTFFNSAVFKVMKQSVCFQHKKSNPIDSGPVTLLSVTHLKNRLWP